MCDCDNHAAKSYHYDAPDLFCLVRFARNPNESYSNNIKKWVILERFFVAFFLGGEGEWMFVLTSTDTLILFGREGYCVKQNKIDKRCTELCAIQLYLFGLVWSRANINKLGYWLLLHLWQYLLSLKTNWIVSIISRYVCLV